jgi:HK97 family phage portal protein
MPRNTSPGLISRMGRGIASVARRARDLIPGQHTGYSLTTPVLSGVVVTPQTALTFTAVYSAINVISTDVAKLPFGVVKTTAKGATKPALSDPRHRLLSVKPNPEMNAMRYRQMQMGHVLGWGNHYSEIIFDGAGMPKELWPLHPGNTRPMRTAPGKALYYEDVNTGKTWLPEQILHIAGLGFDGIQGYSPITMARQAVGLGMGAEQFGAALFGNGARPGGFLKTRKQLTELAAKRLRESFDRVHQGTSNAHRVAILEEGMEWEESQISPESAQFLATRQFQVLEIARIFNLPPHKIGDYSESHRSNVEEANLDYLSSTLQGWLEAIEAEYESKLLFDDEQGRFHFRHDMTALMRGNMTARAAYYKTLFSVAAITPNQIAALEGLPPSKEPRADSAYLQAQFVPIEDAGKAMAAKAGASAADDKVDPEDGDPKPGETT